MLSCKTYKKGKLSGVEKNNFSFPLNENKNKESNDFF